jgi:hypothetical protein
MSSVSLSTSIRRKISDKTLKNAVALLTRAFVGAQGGLSARNIRRTLETEFACNLKARKDLIVRTIQETLEGEINNEEPIESNVNKAASDFKRRKLSSMHAAADELADDRVGSMLNLGDACEYQSAKTNALHYHNPIHSGKRPFACDECDFQSSQKSALTRHKRIHFGERPFACDDCDYRCAKRSNLTAHKRTHSRERPYACDQCDFRCSDHSNLIVHKRTHSGERPYACDECGYRCASSSNLTAHKRIHTGERPFACDECDFRCAQGGGLTTHKRIHSRERSFACDECY